MDFNIFTIQLFKLLKSGSMFYIFIVEFWHKMLKIRVEMHSNIAIFSNFLQDGSHIKFSEFVQPACLPPEDHEDEFYDNMECNISGWGSIDGNKRSLNPTSRSS